MPARIGAGALALVLVVAWAPREAPGDAPEPITPNTIRVQPLAPDARGQWLVVPGYTEIGSPTASRDGQWVAFDAYKEGYNRSVAECWVGRRDGAALTRLTTGATPRWSPDGQRLLFMRDDIRQPVAQPGVFVINRDGTGERRIGEGRRPDWSPDGHSIVFATGGRRGPWGGSRILSRIWTARADGTDRKELADGDAPTWSPDGKKIACIQQDPAYPAPLIRVIELETGRQSILGYGWFRANWSSDSQSVVCNGFTDAGETAMFKYSAEKPGRPELLFPEFRQAMSPCYSGDGKTLVFVARRPAQDRAADR